MWPFMFAGLDNPILDYLEINNIYIYFSLLLLTLSAPLKIGKCTPRCTCTPSYLLRFIFSGNANCVTVHRLYHAWRFLGGFFAFHGGKTDQNNAVILSERTLFRAVKTLSGPSTMRLKTYYVFLCRAPAHVLKRTSLFIVKSAMQNSLCPYTYILQQSSALLMRWPAGSGDARGDCFIVCPLPYSSIEQCQMWS